MTRANLRSCFLLFAFSTFLEPAALRADVLPPEPTYDCYGTNVDQQTFDALQFLKALSGEVTDALFPTDADCGGMFTLDHEPTLFECESPSGEVALLPVLETIHGNYYFGPYAAGYDCDVLGYWESDFTQEPWLSLLTPEQLSEIMAVNLRLGLLWARLHTDQGEVYVAWDLLSMDTPAPDLPHLVMLLGGEPAEPDVAFQMRAWA